MKKRSIIPINREGMGLNENDATIQFRLPHDLKALLTARAKEQGLNISAFLREAIYEFLELHPQTTEAIPEHQIEDINTAIYAFRVPRHLRRTYLRLCEMAGIKAAAPMRAAMYKTVKELSDDLSSPIPTRPKRHY